MTASRNCPQCSKPLSSDSPQGLCPECLVKAAFQTQSALNMEATALDDTSAASAIAPEAGVRLKYFGDYELLEKIASGGMGVVWKARQSSLKRDVALKMIRAGALAGPDEVERFLREAEAAANLQHPNIVAIHEVGEFGGQHYFSMDYVAGRDLGAIVKEGALEPQRAARYVKTIAEAIHFAHQRGTLHRDLKPQNVLIDASDQPRITDFGLAKLMKDDSQLTQSGVVMGSPSYMPPEQAAGRQGDIGPASDVYSLGAMLYELLTGRPPFRAATAMATMRQVMEVEPAAPRKVKADVPPDLETICLKCLEKSPSARYPTARALAEELDRFLKGEPIQTRPASALRKTLSWARRHPGILSALAALVMVALAVGIFYLFQENAFLRAQQANPALARVAGPRHEALEIWATANSFLWFAGFILLVIVQRRARGVITLKNLFDPHAYSRPLQPLDRRTRNFAIGGGLFLLVFGVGFVAKAIEACVWEGGFRFVQIASVYLPSYIAIAILANVVRDHHLVHYGTASRQLTAEQIEPIRRAMEDFCVLAAIKLYRTAVPEAGGMEAHEYVIRLADSLRAQHPGKFVPRPITSPTLNLPGLIISACSEIAILLVVWHAAPPSNPASAISRFAYSFLFGVGVIAGARVQALWKKALLTAPALVLAFITEAMVPSQQAPSPHSVWPFLCGIVCAIVLMICGFNWRRKQTIDHPR